MSTSPMILRFQATHDHHDLPVPNRAYPSDAGLDLRLDLSRPDELLQVNVGRVTWGPVEPAVAMEFPRERFIDIQPGSVFWVPTGYAVAIPEGCEGVVRGRSGLAYKHGITVGHVGTIDAGYRGEIKVCLQHRGIIPERLRHGDRIAQLVIGIIPHRIEVSLGTLPSAPRGVDGFGSTGR